MSNDFGGSLPVAIRNYIDQEVSRATLPTIQQLSDTLGFHPDTLNRRFKKEFGVSLKGYIVRKKMEEGYRLLSQEGRSVRYVSKWLGYNNPSSFSTQFLRIFGCSPGKLKRARGKDGESGE